MLLLKSFLKKSVDLRFVLAGMLFSFCFPGWSQQFQKTNLGVKTIVNGVVIEAQFYSPQIVRILKYPSGTSPKKETLSVIAAPQKTSFDLAAKSGMVAITTSALLLKIDQQTGAASFFTKGGSLLLKEKASAIVFSPSKEPESYTVKQSFQLDAEEPIYGLGQHQRGLMSQRNQALVLQQNNMQIAVPFFQSIKGYGVFWDNYSTTNFKDSSDGTSFESEVGNSYVCF